MTGQDALEDTIETSAALAQTDAFVAQVLAQSAPIRVGVAHTAKELRAVYRLRHRVVIEQGWAAPEVFPDGLERDDYDDGAVQIVAWDGDVLVGTTRLVLPAPNRPLPTEATFGLRIEPAGRVVDVGRICRAPAYEDLHRRVVWGLLSRIWIEMSARGFTIVCGTLASSAARVFRSLGLRAMTLGAGRTYWGEERYPVLMRPAESVGAFRWRVRPAVSSP